MIKDKAYYFDKYFSEDFDARMQDDKVAHHTVYIMQDGTDEYLCMYEVHTLIKNLFLAKIHLILLCGVEILKIFYDYPYLYHGQQMYGYRKATDLERYMQVHNEAALCIYYDAEPNPSVFINDRTEFEYGLPSFIKRLFSRPPMLI
ncbi:MAG: hypothetical protein JRE40_00235 [Deltaproteobacteria bacterium]|nr:hypothetical protein [Deltaproteobacteria bacterium]